MEPIEMLSSLPTTCDYNVSEESDDLDTPLEVWQRLVGKFQGKQGVVLTQKNETSDDGGPGVSIKRKWRHRVRSRDAVSSIAIYGKSSSDTDESEKSKPHPPKRRLRSRKSKLEIKSAPKPQKNKSATKDKVKSKRNVTSKRQDDDFKDADDLFPPEESVKPSTSFSPLRRSKRRVAQSRGVAKSRKPPIEFAEDVSTKRKSRKVVSSEEETCDDSQRTILLDTPEFLDSMEILEDSKSSDANNFQHEEKCSCPEKNVVIDNKDRTIFRDEQQSTSTRAVSNKKASSPTQKIISNLTSSERTCIDESKVVENSSLEHKKTKRTITKLPEMQSTELDDIFFSSHSSSPKKPPPARWKEQSGNSSATAACDSATQESTCSSLWDDDTLWVAK